VIIAGHGVELTLQLPTQAAQLENGTLLFGPTVEDARRGAPIRNVAVKAGTAPDGPLEARPDGELIIFRCATPGATEISLGRGVSSYSDFFTAHVAPQPDGWMILAEDHEAYWPPGFTLAARAIRRERSSYELHFGDATDQMVTVHGPFAPAETPPVPSLAAPGMTMVDSGELPDSYILWFELWYEHAGEPWKQIVYYVPADEDIVYLVRAQARTAAAAGVFAAADMMAQSLRAL
jgi:hypothetical protein